MEDIEEQMPSQSISYFSLDGKDTSVQRNQFIEELQCPFVFVFGAFLGDFALLWLPGLGICLDGWNKKLA